MSAVVTRPRRARARTAGCERANAAGRSGGSAGLGAAAAPTLFDGAVLGGESTLAALVCGVWEELVEQRTVACPLCGGTMSAVLEAPAHPAGRCRDCGTSLE